MLKGIDKNDIESIVSNPTNYEDLLKLAINYSDGVIQNSEETNSSLLDYAREKGIPTLEFQTKETYAEAFNNFYDEIWSKDK